MSWLENSLNAAMLRSRVDLAPAEVVGEADALPGRDAEMPVAPANLATGNPMRGPFPEGHEQIVLGLGCFWGAEKRMWQLDGVWTTAAGYAGGWTKNPTYEETCTGSTGHTEAVLVDYDPAVISTEQVLQAFFESHDPTTRNRQGNDIGTQYRSAIFATTPEQLATAEAMAKRYEAVLAEEGFSDVTTEVGLLSDVRSGEFYYAEDYHQQYLLKNPNGYDCHARTGVACPIG
ncbi:peptide-methionine (S)-S-oxide reductase MsrA [Dietzia sp.]|uniref:peptide-methionine (S)-S-oxide reductase MsrA n=1 Tax=Dietzia sp. TaxID=1871616 RepID=UPI003FA59659